MAGVPLINAKCSARAYALMVAWIAKRCQRIRAVAEVFCALRSKPDGLVGRRVHSFRRSSAEP